MCIETGRLRYDMVAGRWLGCIPFDPGRAGRPATLAGAMPAMGETVTRLSELPSRKSLAKFGFWLFPFGR